MKLTNRIALAAAAVFALVITSGRPARAADACSLLTTAQAASVLGVPDVSAGGSAKTCTWTSKKYVKGAGQLNVVVEGANDGAKMLGRGTPVPGIGDEALLTQAGDGAVLHVRKGTTWFVVNVHGVPLPQATQMEQAVAKEVVPKL
jgi:hypothetical protein